MTASLISEPLDWAMTLGEIVANPLSPSSYLGFIPGVPSSATRFTRSIGNNAVEAASGNVARATGAAAGTSVEGALPGNRVDLHMDLRTKGYDLQGTSPKGFVTYKGPDGKTVNVKPTGEVIPTQRVWKTDGTGKFPQRQDYSGKPFGDQSHSSGHFVESIKETNVGSNVRE